jgi:NAD(P)-dependent dehydrogenase (short-subunit alcohol dehydrogenase family)
MARVLAANGAKRVYLLGRRLAVLEAAAREHDPHGHVFVPLQCDVTSRDSLQAAVDRVTSEVGYVNLLVANSGVVGPSAGWHPTQTLSEIREGFFGKGKGEDAKTAGEEVMAGMTEALRVNVTGAFYTLVAFLELLDAGNKRAVAAGSGKDGKEEKVFGAPVHPGSDVPSIQSQVIVTSSIAAFSRMFMTTPAYGGSKAAIMQLTKHASSNLARFGIRANALAPGRKYPCLSCNWSPWMNTS